MLRGAPLSRTTRYRVVIWLTGAAVLVVGGLLIGRSRHDRGDSVVTTPTTSVIDTTPRTTTPETTPQTTPRSEPPATTTTPTTAAVVHDGFQPPCVESTRADAPATTLDEGALDQFGPLQPEPAIRATLPEGVSSFGGDPQSTSVEPLRIPGGVLLNVRASSSGYFAGSMLAAIDADGAVRWVRCEPDTVAEVFTAPTAKLPRVAVVVAEADSDGITTANEFRLLSLDDGSITGTLAERLQAQGIENATELLRDYPVAWSPTQLLLGPPADAVVDVTRDHLVVVDLLTLAAEIVPFPDESNGSTMIQNSFKFDASGEVYLSSWENGREIVVRSHHDGTWIDARSGLPPSEETVVDFEARPGADGRVTLVATDANGETTWRRDDISSFGGEGFRTATDGPVAVVSGCFGALDSDHMCTKPGLAGVRVSDGQTVWLLDGHRMVSVVRDGYALVTEPLVSAADGSISPGAWLMIDTTTGQAVHGQRWGDPATFQKACCGDSEFIFVTECGGVLVAVSQRQVAVWYPRVADLAPHHVTLP